MGRVLINCHDLKRVSVPVVVNTSWESLFHCKAALFVQPLT